MTQQAEAEAQVSVNRGHVTGYLEDLAEMAQKSGLRSIHQEVVEDRLPALERGQVSLVVLGEFNHGKSTVVNALLGQEVLPMGITPTTAVITHLVHGEEPRAEIQAPRNGGRTAVAYEEMGAAIKHEEEAGVEPEYVE